MHVCTRVETLFPRLLLACIGVGKLSPYVAQLSLGVEEICYNARHMCSVFTLVHSRHSRHNLPNPMEIGTGRKVHMNAGQGTALLGRANLTAAVHGGRRSGQGYG